MSLKKQRINMPAQDPQKRRTNFNEVALGYTKEMAREEAARCLNCKVPQCIKGCPVEVDIPGFITALKKGELSASAQILKDKNNLPAVCGRVCPQESQCEAQCILGKKGQPVAIGRLERYIADWERENQNKEPLKTKKQDKKIAVIGSPIRGMIKAQ